MVDFPLQEFLRKSGSQGPSEHNQKHIPLLPAYHRIGTRNFEEGKLSLEDLRNLAQQNGEPEVISGRQEYYENIVNRFI